MSSKRIYSESKAFFNLKLLVLPVLRPKNVTIDFKSNPPAFFKLSQNATPFESRTTWNFKLETRN